MDDAARVQVRERVREASGDVHGFADRASAARPQQLGERAARRVLQHDPGWIGGHAMEGDHAVSAGQREELRLRADALCVGGRGGPFEHERVSCPVAHQRDHGCAAIGEDALQAAGHVRRNLRRDDPARTNSSP